MPSSKSSCTSPCGTLLDRLIGPWSALMMFTMMSITVVDVVGRYAFSSPLQGGFEITETLLAFIIFAGLPIVSKEDTHITVDLATTRFSMKARRLQHLASDSTAGLLCVGLSGAMAYKAMDLWMQNETTPHLALPVAPLSAFMSLSCLLTAFIYGLRIWQTLTRPEGSPVIPDRKSVV